MNFTGHESHDITLNEAAAMTKRYRDTITAGQTIAHYFGGDAINAILQQTGAVGIRIYYGLNDTNQKQLIITGVDSAGNDLYLGSLAERSVTCPIDCSSANPLNTTPTI